jgi:hypothetical protein
MILSKSGMSSSGNLSAGAELREMEPAESALARKKDNFAYNENPCQNG